jgi:nucleoside-diphosphate-sugar epimerase
VRILVTGATGFIGSHLVPVLAATNEIHAITRGPHADVPGVEWIEHDLRDPIENAPLPTRIDTVVHLAQSRRYRDFPGGAPDIFALNVGSTFELVEYARRAGATRFVFTSTGGVYGHGDERFVEEDVVNPINFYLASKHAAETILAPYVTQLHTIVLRLFFVYGPGQGQMLISSLARKVLAGEPITIEGDPGIRINPLYVDDAVRVLERTLQHDASLLCNVAGHETVTISDLVHVLGDIVGRAPAIEHIPADHNGDIVGDTKRMEEELGVTPRVSLHDGLSQVVAALPR